ncbi:hypothetical protein GY45DRAFT_1439440 [Cubamyces sp. BRFM 1775]|nr:hypothetical protein GY45DRAFT_1439440 [Cubamyces sp. BRFM 1775]
MLCEIPVELQIRILLHLDIVDLVGCTTLCKHIGAIIKDSAILQYKLELCATGMVDTGGLPGLSVSERLSRLRAYEGSWYFTPLTSRPHPASKKLNQCSNLWKASDDTIAYTSEGMFKLLRLPSVSRGVPEMTWSLDPPRIKAKNIASISVDHAQDLMVVSRWVRRRTHGHIRVRLKGRFLSVQQKGAPHPLAALPVHVWDVVPNIQDADCHTSIHGDLIGCTIGKGHKHMQVFNWKTGILVWRHRSTVRAFFQILDSSKVLLVEDYTMYIHTFDPSATTSVPGGNVARSHCELQLPPVVDTNPLLSKCEAQSMSASFAHCNSVFAPDPSLAVIAVEYRIDWSMWGPYTSVALLMLLPIRTLLSQADRASEQRKIAPTQKVSIPWDDWGPDGTRCLLLENETRGISVVGSKCALHFRESYRTTLDDEVVDVVVIIDARPWVHMAPYYDHPNHYPGSELFFLGPASPRAQRLLASPLRSTLPYKILCRVINLRPELDARQMILQENGLAVAHMIESYAYLDNVPEDERAEESLELLLT